MTRGQIAIIHNWYGKDEISVMTSTEFNGDMYLDGHGEEVIELLKKVHDVADYQYVVAKFNCDNHHYNDLETLTLNYDKDKAQRMLDFTKDYFDNWFSDYVYLKNITKKDVEIVSEVRDDNGDTIDTTKTIIKPNDIVTLCFGRIVVINKE